MQISILKRVKPAKIYFVVDGARKEIDGESELVNAVKQSANDIDWECDCIEVFADYNMGCDKRVVSALDYVFEIEKKAIILEDDCIPTYSFFYYCEVLLDKYENSDEIMYISGTKQVQKFFINNSYGFSYNTGTWGWATWDRAWKEWHWDVEEWERGKNSWLEGIYSARFRKNWIKDVENYFDKRDIPWDYIWRFCVGKRLSIFPAVNLIQNIGFDDNATHTGEDMYGYDSYTEEMPELIHPMEIIPDLDYPKAIEKQYRVPVFYRVKRKLKK